MSVPALASRTVTGPDGRYVLDLPAARLADADSVTVLAQRVGSDRQARSLAADGEAGAVVNFALPSSALALEGLVVAGSGMDAPADAVAWREVEREEAERSLGRPLVAVPQLPLLGIDVGKMEGRAAVRVRQQREDGSVLSLVQSRTPRTRASRPETLTRSVAERGGWRIVLEEEGLLVEASAPVGADSLRRLPPPGPRL